MLTRFLLPRGAGVSIRRLFATSVPRWNVKSPAVDKAPFQWEELFNGLVFMANGFDAWASVVCVGEFFFACGGVAGAAATTIMQSKNRGLALASADDFLRKHGDHKMARKTKKWLVMAPTDKQREFLGLSIRPPGSRRKKGDTMSRYWASCLLTWKFSKDHLRRLLGLSKTFAEPAVVPPPPQRSS